uniref:RING-type domain-containing protein n=1 Tax=Zooxanthella nutricula TaxID=1333877 RepID=A0A7S2HSX7_9DINO
MIREDMQRTVSLLTKQGDQATVGHEVVERLLKDERQELEQRRSQLEQQRVQVERREEKERQLQTSLSQKEKELEQFSEMCDRKLRDLEWTANARGIVVQDLRDANQVLNRDVKDLESRLAWWEAKHDRLQSCESESDVAEWERALLDAVLLSLKKLADRRVELRVALQSPAGVDDRTMCKICFDKPSSCALLPCKHHHFCKACALRVEGTRGAVCPLCRTKVTGVFETC